ncbi:hypothetical protein RhiTH_011094 [Rhizoctonia solani]
MLRLTYGYRPQNEKDMIYMNAIQALMNFNSSVLMSNFLVNAFPILARLPDWAPGTGWKRTARKWREQKNEALDAPYQWTKQQIARGDFEHSVLSSLLDEDEYNSELSTIDQEKELKELCYTLFIAYEQLATALLSFVAAMIKSPDAQMKAQAEVDSAIGYATRLPRLTDIPQLPYIRRLTLEVLRWLPVAPTGMI